MSSSSDSNPKRSTEEINASQARSLRLAWGITLGELVLFGALVWLFADYWMMLPVRFRIIGIVGLSALAAIGVFRLVRFFRRSAQSDESANR